MKKKYFISVVTFISLLVVNGFLVAQIEPNSSEVLVEIFEGHPVVDGMESCLLGVPEEPEARTAKKQIPISNFQSEPYKLLVFHKEAAGWFTHESIADGIKMFRQMAIDKGFEIDVSDDSTLFTKENLEQYHAIAFLNTSDDFFTEEQKLAFQNFIRSGKGWVGIHSADNTLNKWEWYHQMIGTGYRGDSWQNDLPLIIVDTDNPSVKGLPNPWSINDQYRKNTWRFNETTPGFNVIIKVDPKHYEGRIGNGEDDWSNQLFVPYVYTHEFEGGRIWFGGMGHGKQTFENKNWIKIIGWGVDYAFGKFLPQTFA